jgi:hypothetical protein
MDAVTEGVWQYADGSLLGPSGYSRWNRNEPNNAGGGEHYTCVGWGGSGWNDYFWSTAVNALCSTIPGRLTYGDCSAGFAGRCAACTQTASPNPPEAVQTYCKMEDSSSGGGGWTEVAFAKPAQGACALLMCAVCDSIVFVEPRSDFIRCESFL